MTFSNRIPALTQGLRAAFVLRGQEYLKAGDTYVPRIDRNAGTGPAYWVNQAPAKVPAGCIARIVRGNPAQVGMLVIERV